MKKRMLFILTGVLVIGVISGIGYANSKNELSTPISDLTEKRIEVKEDLYDSMLNLMKQNGYESMSEAMEKGDYKAMDDFMNNLSDEDYNKMIEIMDQNGYGNMARMMESIDKEAMIQMHNSMGGARGMMNSGMMRGRAIQ